ncbi:putative S-adenosylmethionine-dependent methyltransferase [Aspergillus luchuensis]|uniref:Protein-lysine N-methyltransferase EFM4 n=1 Tax=Aspergillus kawachii TaxID=1069201 RepID=A0A7R7W176_ASPKA|nr:uncharacterized protein AKAW2_11544S [Aspergillus luchuensis]BCR94498.1 hypothetical protein AKAW2_11544S [Aspergillus luchuensis]BCS07094.1 hypothetical protein ALUC_11475S [Aspergillus luchuensis]GAA85368.1 S-adenosylmethionine-dependent methyltransferase [Aspergillus luchuensis IFO 4308]
MADDSHPAHLSPSELGTKDYWETFYARTLSHLSTKHTTTTTTTSTKPNTESSSEESEDEEEDDIDDDSDPGTSWFSEHNAPDKVLQFLTDEEFPLAPVNTDNSKDGDGDEQAPSILDLGTGNGSMLALLRKRGGYKGVMVGIDYSIRSVQLARELQRLRIHSAYLSDSEDDGEDEGGKEGEGGDTNIRFEEWDILHGDVYETTSEEEGCGDRKGGKVDWFPYDKGGFDIVLDKGTFDAVSLSDEVIPDADGAAAAHASGKTVQRRVCERYPGIVRGLVRKGGFVVVTSCNWTEEELVAWFTRADSTSSGGDGKEDKFVVWGRVEYPRFRFGGREGQGVCTVCFQRV